MARVRAGWFNGRWSVALSLFVVVIIINWKRIPDLAGHA